MDIRVFIRPLISILLIPPSAELRFADKADDLPLNLIWDFETTSFEIIDTPSSHTSLQ